MKSQNIFNQDEDEYHQNKSFQGIWDYQNSKILQLWWEKMPQKGAVLRASESIKLQNFFNHGEDEKYQNKSFWWHLRVSKVKLSSTIVKIKKVVLGHLRASNFELSWTLVEMRTAKKYNQNDGGESFLTWLYWRMQKPSKIHGFNLGLRCCFRNVVA